jgi:hypothetical protein
LNHLPITFRFEDTDLETPNEADNQKFVFKKENKTDWVSLLSHKLNFTNTRRHEICTPERLDHLINTLTKAMTETSTEICLSKKPPPQSHLWFTKEVKIALTNVRRAKNRLRSVRRRKIKGIPLFNSMAAVRANRNKLRRTIQKAKRDWAYEFTSNIDPANIWKLNSWYRGNCRYTMPTLKDPKGKTVISTTEKTDLFMVSFFPPPPILNEPLANLEEFNPNA